MPPEPLPSCLTAEHKVPDSRNPRWLAYPLPAGERVKVEQALIELEQRLVPATNEEICAMLKAYADYHGLTDKDGTLTTKFVMMAEDLQGFSAAHIAMAIKEHRQSSNWFAKSPELRAPCIKRQATALVMRKRARVLLGMEQPAPYDVPPPNETDGPPPVNLKEKLAQLPPQLRHAVSGLLAAAKTDRTNPRALEDKRSSA